MVRKGCLKCGEKFEAKQPWMDLCLRCWKQERDIEKVLRKRREEAWARRKAAEIDARKVEARAAWRKLKGPGEGQTGEV